MLNAAAEALAGLALAAATLALAYTLILGAAGRRRRAAGGAPAPARLAVLVPAHNEERWLPGLLADLRAQTRPPDRLLVVADRCTDGTAAAARKGGAAVLERVEGMGDKAGAVAAGLEALDREPWDAVVLVDADCRLGPEYLAGLRVGPGEAVQTLVRLRSGGDGRGLLYEFLSRLENATIHRGRERLGLPAFLRGTGMVFGRAALARCPWRGSGLTEDRAQGLAMLRAGVKLRCRDDLEVVSAPPGTAGEGWRQRRRWTSRGLPAAVTEAVAVAAAAPGARTAELPLAVLADARSQWVTLILLGGGLDLAAGGALWGWTAALLALTLGAGALTGFIWYRGRFLRALAEVPAAAAAMVGAGALALLGRRPGAWTRGRGEHDVR